MPLYLYTSDFILSLCLCFLHRYQSALKFTSSSDSYVSDSNFIPSLLNSRDIALLDVNGDVGVSNKDCEVKTLLAGCINPSRFWVLPNPKRREIDDCLLPYVSRNPDLVPRSRGGWCFFDWESLVQALHVRFGSTAYDDPMEVLTRLRQTPTVASYKAEFEAVSNRIKGLSPLHKLSCFLSGLKDMIRLPVRMLNPQSLNAAFGLAKIQEENVLSCKRNAKYQQESSKNSILGLPKGNTMVEAKTRIPIKRITPAQVEERKKKGLFNCDEKWGPGINARM